MSPAERKLRLVLPKRGWTPTLNAYYDELPRKCDPGLEYMVIGQVIRNTWGGDSQLRDSAVGRRDRREDDGKPAFAPLKAADLVDLLRHSEQAISDALQKAEDHHFIEVRMVGHEKWYRACPEKFGTGEDREPTKLPSRKPPATAKDAHVQQVPPGEPLVILPGAKSRPFVLRDNLRARIRSRLEFPVAVLPRFEGEQLEIELTPWKPPQDNQVNGEEQAKLTRSRLPPSKHEFVNNKEIPPSPAALDLRQGGGSETGLMRDLLNRWFQRKLGPVDDEIVRQAEAARGEKTLNECANRFVAKPVTSWADVVRVIGNIPPQNGGFGFENFMGACTEAGLPASRVDWEEARKLWSVLSLDDRLSASRGIKDRIACGEFSEEAFRPRPDTYLKKRSWERALRGKNSKAQKSSEEKIASAARRARALEGRT